MTISQRLIVSSALVVMVGAIVFSDFTWLKSKTAKLADKDDAKLSADGTIPDPYMMLEVNPQIFPNASGSSKCLTLEQIPF